MTRRLWHMTKFVFMRDLKTPIRITIADGTKIDAVVLQVDGCIEGIRSSVVCTH
ncbi:hypothetical protein Pcac1_g7356 [Phytophthora cactorum]|nr:hypothetical protein Pcac1_g7356 [Phytophthora cactorum]